MNVLITGAAGGLGRAFAIECAKRGFTIFLTDINQEGLDRIIYGLTRQFSVTAFAKACDLTDEKETAELIRYISLVGMKLDMLLNVAGVDFEGGFSARSFDQISKILNLNIEATLRTTHYALKERRADSDFYIVFVSSLAAMNPMPLKAVYAASKRFLLDFSYALGQELKARKVHVLALCPGGLATTEEALSGIAAQGFWGNISTNNIEKVVRNTFNRVLKKRRLYIPGAFNNILSFFSRLLPARLIAKIIFLRWNRSQQKWLHDSAIPD